MRKKLMAGPYLLWMLVFTIVPLLFVFYYGFTSSDGAFTFSNITAIFEKIHIQALGLSLLLAVITTAVCLLLAYPLALILSKAPQKPQLRYIHLYPAHVDKLPAQDNRDKNAALRQRYLEQRPLGA